MDQRLGERRGQDRLIQRQWRTFDDPYTLELEDGAVDRDTQGSGLGLDGRTDPRLAHPRGDCQSVDRCPVREALRATDGLDRDGPPGDEPSRAIARDEQALRGQVRERATQGVTSDLQAGPELALRSQTLTWRQSSGSNVGL